MSNSTLSNSWRKMNHRGLESNKKNWIEESIPEIDNETRNLIISSDTNRTNDDEY
jgi:hypothetical protein